MINKLEQDLEGESKKRDREAMAAMDAIKGMQTCMAAAELRDATPLAAGLRGGPPRRSPGPPKQKKGGPITQWSSAVGQSDSVKSREFALRLHGPRAAGPTSQRRRSGEERHSESRVCLGFHGAPEPFAVQAKTQTDPDVELRGCWAAPERPPINGFPTAAMHALRGPRHCLHPRGHRGHRDSPRPPRRRFDRHRQVCLEGELERHHARHGRLRRASGPRPDSSGTSTRRAADTRAARLRPAALTKRASWSGRLGSLGRAPRRGRRSSSARGTSENRALPMPWGWSLGALALRAEGLGVAVSDIRALARTHGRSFSWTGCPARACHFWTPDASPPSLGLPLS